MAAVDAGMNRWDAQRRATGSFAPKPQGGDTRSRRIEARHAEVMAAFEEERDQSLEELRARLAERGIAASTSATRKKTGHAVEQDRADVLGKRRAWFEAQPGLEPERLVFVDGEPLERHWFKPNGERDSDQHGAQPRAVSARRPAAHGLPARSPQDHHVWSRACG